MLRVVSDGDFIPRVPPTFWPFLYYHPGDLVTLPVLLVLQIVRENIAYLLLQY